MRFFRHDRSHTRFESLPLRATKLLSKKLAFFVFVFLVFPGAVAYASFFSYLSNLGDFVKVNVQEKSINSQSDRYVALLASASGPDLPQRDNSADVNTVDGSALLYDAGPAGGMADVADTDANHGQISTYVVREGDTFSSIAGMFGVSVNTVLWANDLSRGAKLTVGQTLVILPVSGVQYTVKKGDTIGGIAKKFKGDVDEIRSYNGIAPGSILDVGSVIIIPDGEFPISTAARSTTARLRGAGGPSYDGYYQAPLSSYRKTQGLHGYNGVDLVATGGYGSPVMAAAGGEVIVARQGGYNGGYGNYVVVRHANETQTLYGHLRTVAVAPGDIVRQGEVIGYEGNSGRSTGTHLHFEVRGAKNPF